MTVCIFINACVWREYEILDSERSWVHGESRLRAHNIDSFHVESNSTYTERENNQHTWQWYTDQKSKPEKMSDSGMPNPNH